MTKGQEAVSTLPLTINVVPCQLDITSDFSVAECVDFVQRTYCWLDILINNAGILDSGSTMRERYTSALSVNAISVACLTDACLPIRKKPSCPRIVFVSSGLGSLTVINQAYTERPTYYRASKAALNMIGLCYARILEADGFLLNVCNPGINATGLALPVGVSAERLVTLPACSNGAINTVRLATLEKGAETGTYPSKGTYSLGKIDGQELSKV